MGYRWSFRGLVAVVVLVGLLAGCEPGAEKGAAAVFAGPAMAAAAAPEPSRAPAPVRHGRLVSLAEPVAGRLALHTAAGDVTFWTGVNLGSTTPGHSPGELALTRADADRWLAEMGRLGVTVLRVYTIMPPQVYQALEAYNRAHPDDPVYLVQGVYLPDESYVATRDLYEPGPTRAFTAELRDASAAVRGALRRGPVPGRAGGVWTADVSPWVAAWLVGVEWDPVAVAASDRRNAAAPEHRGRYFSSAADATPTTPTERWIAARMDELATVEAGRGRSVPIGFVNWPTTDPLTHPQEPSDSEDLVGVDANHVRATSAWPGGTFASFHAYPYYPDFLRHQGEYQQFAVGGRTDPYAGYLADLKEHFGRLPLLVTEVGVPSSLGSAHLGPLGRDQGGHSEQGALATDAALVRLIHDVGLGGALLFSWSDEWFKHTWNTLPRQAVADAERRALWHDPLTNEQWFGLLAQDPVRAGWRVIDEQPYGVRELAVDHDASYAYLRVRFAAPPVAPVRLGFDVVPGGPDGQDVRVVLDPAGRTAQAQVRADLDPLQLDKHRPADLPAVPADGWSVHRLSTNRSSTAGGRHLPAQYQQVGDLREGRWDPADPAQDSRSTWHLDGDLLELRLPWSLLGLGDPSSLTAVQPVNGLPVAVPVSSIGVVVDAGPDGRASGQLRWEGWQQARATERLKPGVQPLVDAWAELSRPAS